MTNNLRRQVLDYGKYVVCIFFLQIAFLLKTKYNFIVQTMSAIFMRIEFRRIITNMHH